jgi:uncharacterized membrane protein
MTIDQAFQYILSFGVVVPDEQVRQARLLAAAISANGEASMDAGQSLSLERAATNKGDLREAGD